VLPSVVDDDFDVAGMRKHGKFILGG
jgi:hypothetical protein